jgi:cation:H+ antiporter
VTFLAITTSLPEPVTGLAAVRMEAYDLAVGNLFGSNAFNIFALLFVGLAYRPGPVYGALSDASALAAFAAVLLTATGMMGVLFRSERRIFLIEPDAAAIIVVYLGAMWLLYQAGA